MARSAVVLGAIFVLAGGTQLAVGLTRETRPGLTPEASAAMASATTQLDGEIKAARGAVRTRATTLSKLLPVRAVVVTDIASANDALRNGELAFSPSGGEVIELGQVKAGKPTMFLIQPQGAMRSPHAGAPGSYAEMMDDRLVITEVTEVVPVSDAIKDGVPINGYVSVSRPLELTPSITRLEQAGITGRIEIGGKSRAIGTPPADAIFEERPLPSSDVGAQLVVAVPKAKAAMPIGLIGAGAASFALGLVFVVVGFRTASSKASSPPPAVKMSETPPPAQPYASTQLSAHAPVAAGTPSPVDAAGSSLINPNSVGPGAMIGRWEVVRRLGSGGMADVYLAHSKGEAGFEKLVAIKVMHGHLARNQRAVDHFLDEARLAARINHPNVVAIQDLGKIGNDYVIVMDYVEGVDLERLLISARAAERPVPIDVGLGILCRICDGLHAAHTAVGPDGTALGIIHRDVKSANVLVSRQGGIKIVDFGIAKATAQVHHTIAGETKGTPSMMAPEQRVGDQVDVRADVYSVAAVAFEVLTGHAVNLDLAALAHLGIENWPHLPLPSSLRPNLPQELDTLLLTAMAYDRERRPADCAAFESMFETVMKNNRLTASDKDIARWVETELRLLVPAYQGMGPTVSKPAGAS